METPASKVEASPIKNADLVNSSVVSARKARDRKCVPGISLNPTHQLQKPSALFSAQCGWFRTFPSHSIGGTGGRMEGKRAQYFPYRARKVPRARLRPFARSDSILYSAAVATERKLDFELRATMDLRLSINQPSKASVRFISGFLSTPLSAEVVSNWGGRWVVCEG